MKSYGWMLPTPDYIIIYSLKQFLQNNINCGAAP